MAAATARVGSVVRVPDATRATFLDEGGTSFSAAGERGDPTSGRVWALVHTSGDTVIAAALMSAGADGSIVVAGREVSVDEVRGRVAEVIARAAL